MPAERLFKLYCVLQWKIDTTKKKEKKILNLLYNYYLYFVHTFAFPSTPGCDQVNKFS